MTTTSLTPQQKGAISNLVEHGLTVEETAARRRIHLETLQQWLADPEFRRQLKARKLQLLKDVARERQTARREALLDMGGDLAEMG